MPFLLALSPILRQVPPLQMRKGQGEATLGTALADSQQPPICMCPKVFALWLFPTCRRLRQISTGYPHHLEALNVLVCVAGPSWTESFIMYVSLLAFNSGAYEVREEDSQVKERPRRPALPFMTELSLSMKAMGLTPQHWQWHLSFNIHFRGDILWKHNCNYPEEVFLQKYCKADTYIIYFRWAETYFASTQVMENDSGQRSH